jgi:hypothetical protein
MTFLPLASTSMSAVLPVTSALVNPLPLLYNFSATSLFDKLSVMTRKYAENALAYHLENRDYLGFRMIFKVSLNQIFSNFNTMLYTINQTKSVFYGTQQCVKV